MMTTPGFAPGFDAQDDFGDVTAEYSAVRDAAGLVDRSNRLRMLFAGRQPAMTLTGLVTNDVVALRPGEGQFAGALTPKGKVIADVRILARADDFLVDTGTDCGPGFAAMIRRYVNPRLATYTDVSAVLRCVGVYGPDSAAAVAAVLSCAPSVVTALAPYQHVRVPFHETPIHLLRSTAIDGIGFDCFVPVEHAATLWDAFVRHGVRPVGRTAFEIARVEAGIPRWGIDMNDDTLAHEAGLDTLGGISYTKGCYTGQETVARLHFRGHVNKLLRVVHAAMPLRTGDAIVNASGDVVGDVRSVASSPRSGPVAIAMIRVAEHEGLVAVNDAGTRTPITVDIPSAS
mgnify:FL=1